MRDGSGRSPARTWTLRSVIVVNGLVLFLAINPWLDAWSAQAATVLVVEVVALVVIGLPAVLFQVTVRKKTFKQSLGDTLEAVMDFLSGAV